MCEFLGIRLQVNLQHWQIHMLSMGQLMIFHPFLAEKDFYNFNIFQINATQCKLMIAVASGERHRTSNENGDIAKELPILLCVSFLTVQFSDGEAFASLTVHFRSLFLAI